MNIDPIVPKDRTAWFVVHALPHRELSAQTHLRGQGYRVFLPTIDKTIRHARKFRRVRAPLFLRYLFVQMNLAHDRWRSVRGTFGVANLLMEGDFPKPLRPDVIDALLAAADPDGLVRFEAALRPGDTVKVTTGVLAGFVGELVGLDAAGRVQVLLDLMGGPREITLPSAAMVPVDRLPGTPDTTGVP